MRIAEPAIQVLVQGSSELLRHGDSIMLLATPVAAASVLPEKESLHQSTAPALRGQLTYEYRVVNRKHGCLISAARSDWGLTRNAKRAALQAKGRGAVERYRQQRKEWDDKAAELAKNRASKLYPTRPHVRTWHGGTGCNRAR